MRRPVSVRTAGTAVCDAMGRHRTEKQKGTTARLATVSHCAKKQMYIRECQFNVK